MVDRFERFSFAISEISRCWHKIAAEEMEAYGLKTGRVRIAHCQNEEGAMKLRDMVVEKFGTVDVEVYTFRGLCSFYAEKGGILVGFEKY